MSGKILVIRGGAIGDFILTLPVLSSLRSHFPGARIEILGYGHIAALAQAGGLADAVHSIEARSLASFFAKGGPLDPRMTQFFARFSLIISYLYDPDEIFQENVKRCGDAQYLVGPHQPDQFPQVHATASLCKPLERLAIYDTNEIPRLLLKEIDPAPRFSLAIHPGSGSEQKNWPDYKWRDFLPRLSERIPGNLLLVGGESESERLGALQTLLPVDRFTVMHNQDLITLAGSLARCRGFVGHDSGITHLAAALGLPTLVLWGPTKESVWRPLGEHVRILREPAGLNAITVDQVLEALDLLMA